MVGGSGGGRPDLAEAGGKDTSALETAVGTVLPPFRPVAIIRPARNLAGITSLPRRVCRGMQNLFFSLRSAVSAHPYAHAQTKHYDRVPGSCGDLALASTARAQITTYVDERGKVTYINEDSLQPHHGSSISSLSGAQLASNVMVRTEHAQAWHCRGFREAGRFATGSDRA